MAPAHAACGELCLPLASLTVVLCASSRPTYVSAGIVAPFVVAAAFYPQVLGVGNGYCDIENVSASSSGVPLTMSR